MVRIEMTKCEPGSRPTGVGEAGAKSPAAFLSREMGKAKAQWITNNLSMAIEPEAGTISGQ